MSRLQLQPEVPHDSKLEVGLRGGDGWCYHLEQTHYLGELSRCQFIEIHKNYLELGARGGGGATTLPLGELSPISLMSFSCFLEKFAMEPTLESIFLNQPPSVVWLPSVLPLPLEQPQPMPQSVFFSKT